MATFSERLCEALEMRNMKPAQLAKLLNVDQGTIHNYQKGKYSPKQLRTEQIADILGVSIPWLMGADVPSVRLKSPIITDDVVVFPVIGEIAAGYDMIATEDWAGDTVHIPTAYLKGHKVNDYFVLVVKGNSMYPLYQDGDKVLILKQDHINNSGDIGAVMYDSECATLKKIELQNELVRLVPINPEYQPKEIKGNDIEQCCILGIPRLLIREIN